MARTETTRRRTHRRSTSTSSSKNASRAQRKTTSRPRRGVRSSRSGTRSSTSPPRSPRSGTRARTSPRSRTTQATRGRAQRRDPEIEAFLQQFTTYLTSGDGPGAAACFEYPALMVMGDAKYGPSQVLPDNGTVADFFSKAPQMYADRGVHDTFPDVESVEWIARDLALARVRFPYIDEDGNDMGDSESSLYVIRRSGQGFSIAAAVTLGVESERER